MRTIPAAAQAILDTAYGVESNLIVRVWWNGVTPYDYSDKVSGTLGRILSISGLDDVIGIDGSSNSASVSVVVDDASNDILSIINQNDTHKVKAQVLQWFEGLDPADAFVLFTGEVNTPLQWSEGERTFSFTILNQLENLELGFSLEEGIVNGIPVTAYGKPFPLVFGSVLKVPALELSESPSGITAQGFARVYDTVYGQELNDLQLKIQQAFDYAAQLFLAGVGAASIAATYNDGDDTEFSPPDDYSTYTSYLEAANQYYQQSDEYMAQMQELIQQRQALSLDYFEKRQYALGQVIVASANFPRGIPVIVEIDDTRLRVIFNGIVMQILEEITVTNLRPGQRYVADVYDQSVLKVYDASETQVRFRWFDAGTKIRVISVPMYYVACLGVNNTITAVYGRKNGVRVRIPNNLYAIGNYAFTNSQRTAVAKVIVMAQPLTTLLDVAGQQIYDGDDVWCDITSSVPGNFISILTEVVQNYTTLSVDPTTFSEVSGLTVNNPMNFAVLERTNVYNFIKDLCYQARTAVWVDDDVVKLRYLPKRPTEVDTITPADVVQESLSIYCSETEQLVTKVVADWRVSLDQDNPNKVIARQNVKKYGVLEEQINMFAYNTHELVQRVAVFWLIRKSNSWKKLRLKTFFNKLKLESHDPVKLSGFGNLFSNGEIIGIVESAVYDSSTNTIDMDIWLPIRWGEMNEYVFAYTADVVDLWGNPNLPDFRTGNPFEASVDTNNLLGQVATSFLSYGPSPPVNRPGAGIDISDKAPSVNVNTAVLNPNIIYGRPTGLADANNRKRYDLKVPTPVVVDDGSTGNCDIGIVQSRDDAGAYTILRVGGGTAVATQLRIAEGYVIPNDTPVYIVKKGGQWYMQAPTWAQET